MHISFILIKKKCAETLNLTQDSFQILKRDMRRESLKFFVTLSIVYRNICFSKEYALSNKVRKKKYLCGTKIKLNVVFHFVT